MTTTVEKVFSSVKFGEPQSHENMVIIPLISVAAEELVDTDFITLDEALKQNLAEVQELAGGGSVPTLKIINKGPKPILITDGETVMGGQQDREINISILIPGKKDIEIPVEIEVPVSCVERSRWAGGRRQAGSGRSSYGRLRAVRTKGMQKMAFSSGEYSSPQSEIWSEIEGKHFSFATRSSTRTMHDVYDKIDKNLEKFGKTFKVLPGQVGIIVVIDGEIAGMDYYGLHKFLKSNWKKILEGYILDAVEALARGEAKPCKVDEAIKKAQEFVTELKEAKTKTIKKPRKSAGDDLRLDSEEVTGSALVRGDKVLHMSAFSDEAWEGKGKDRGPRRRSRREQSLE